MNKSDHAHYQVRGKKVVFVHTLEGLDNCTYKSRLLKNVLRHGGSTPKCLVRVTNTAWYQPHHSGWHALDHSCIMSTRSGGTSQGQHCFPTKYVGKSCATLSR